MWRIAGYEAIAVMASQNLPVHPSDRTKHPRGDGARDELSGHAVASTRKVEIEWTTPWGKVRPRLNQRIPGEAPRTSTPAVVRDLAAWRSRVWGGHRVIVVSCVDIR
jgi:hypothetical protein